MARRRLRFATHAYSGEQTPLSLSARAILTRRQSAHSHGHTDGEHMRGLPRATSDSPHLLWRHWQEQQFLRRVLSVVSAGRDHSVSCGSAGRTLPVLWWSAVRRQHGYVRHDYRRSEVEVYVYALHDGVSPIHSAEVATRCFKCFTTGTVGRDSEAAWRGGRLHEALGFGERFTMMPSNHLLSPDRHGQYGVQGRKDFFSTCRHRRTSARDFRKIWQGNVRQGNGNDRFEILIPVTLIPLTLGELALLHLRSEATTRQARQLDGSENWASQAGHAMVAPS